MYRIINILILRYSNNLVYLVNVFDNSIKILISFVFIHSIFGLVSEYKRGKTSEELPINSNPGKISDSELLLMVLPWIKKNKDVLVTKKQFKKITV